MMSSDKEKILVEAAMHHDKEESGDTMEITPKRREELDTIVKAYQRARSQQGEHDE